MKEGTPSHDESKTGEKIGGIRETYRKPLENTEEEEYVVDRYVELQTKALELDHTEEETSAVEAELRELFRYLSEQTNMDETFRADMKKQVGRLVSNFVSIKNIQAKFEELEANTRKDDIPWGIRRELMDIIEESRQRYGLEERIYQEFVERLADYEWATGAAQVLYRHDDK